MRINLGAGGRLAPGYVNVDRVLPVLGEYGTRIPYRVDQAEMELLLWDLDQLPWPFDDESASVIEARDIFEHVDNAVGFMTECWRILAPYKLLHLHTPHYSCIDAFTDPTHKRFPTEHTFDYWLRGTTLYQHNPSYGGVTYERVNMFMDNGSMDITLRKVPE